MSGVIRFISDLHFSHQNMAVKREFDNYGEMNEIIIKLWNSVVNKKDITWILGDVTMEKSDYDLLNRLNGFKRVVLGNHDKGNHVKKLLQYVNTVHGLHQLRSKKFGSIWLSHAPIHPTQLERCRYNIHGHVLGDDVVFLLCAG